MRELWRTLVNVVTSPAAAVRETLAAGSHLSTAVALLVAIIGVGAVTLPRQLQLLRRSLGPTGNALNDAHHAALVSGLTRLVVFDRLLPPPTVLLAALLVMIVAEPSLGWAENHRWQIRTVILLGLVPLLFQRTGELAITYLADVSTTLAPGVPVTLPRQFVTGPAVLWWGGDAPAWVEALSSRVNLITLWSVGLWAVALRELDRRPLSLWHLAVPSLCLGLAGAVTWWAGPMVLAIVLGNS